MILKTGQIIPVEISVKVLAPFAYNDRIYYLVKPLQSYSDTVWIISADGEALAISNELLLKASCALDRVEKI